MVCHYNYVAFLSLLSVSTIIDILDYVNSIEDYEMYPVSLPIVDIVQRNATSSNKKTTSNTIYKLSKSILKV